MEKYTTHKKIEQKIGDSPDGTLFVTSDFYDLGSVAAVRKSLSRLVNDNTLTRELRGIYKKPLYNNFIKEYVKSTPKEIANAYARSNGWRIVPSGNTALNELGLSTQVPNVNVFISDGPYRNLVLPNKTTIRFKHVRSNEISNISYDTALLIEAIKELKHENITPKVLTIIRSRYSEDEIRRIKWESSRSRSWIYEKILKL